MNRIPEDILWSSVVRNLRKKGWTYNQLAQETGFTVVELREMEDEEWSPPWISSLKLLDLHVDHCPENHVKNKCLR
jgi:lambda repressor-like predicted transcriptional regulator